jgi:hypothetical protein
MPTSLLVGVDADRAEREAEGGRIGSWRQAR